ncbi:MAG: L-lactate dehydrogenase [Parcubacteria group bacterium]|jgi:L-lactate dehydrogenase
MKNKVTIIGAGMVGSTVAYSLVLQDIVEEIALMDLNEELVKAQVMDLQHSVPFVGRTDVKVGTYDDCADSDVVVITCGAAQKPGETRLDLVQKNAAIIKGIVPQVFEKNPNTILVMVTNPVDVLTKLAISLFPDKKDRIMGTGTLLDSARFRELIGLKMDIDPKSIHAYILGEHGDSEFPVWSMASIGNMKLGTCNRLNDDDKTKIFEEAKNAAYTIIAGKQSTYYAIGAGCAHLVQTIVHDKKSVLPVSHAIEGAYGIDDVCLSMPAVVGCNGIEGRLCIELNEEEQKNLQHTAEVLKETFASIA